MLLFCFPYPLLLVLLFYVPITGTYHKMRNHKVVMVVGPSVGLHKWYCISCYQPLASLTALFLVL